MFITKTITKKLLENLIYDSFLLFGNLSTAALLDSLKLLGFYYATNAGISINIEDLKTPKRKKYFLEKANLETQFVSQQWATGFVSDAERFQTIIDSWNFATESLKSEIVSCFQTLDPTNNLYIMAFSGARGNMSQVRQLVGMRGLMSDQEGKIIDLPIQANFREGLSSIDYIVSSYGARKGIVDTALKTADSGYLTRRLIYVAQDLLIRDSDCGTKNGLLLLLSKKTPSKNFIGRNVLWAKKMYFPYENKFQSLEKSFLTEKNFKNFQQETPLLLNLRSILTCQAYNSICQKCYGSDLAQGEIISLGEVVGILAAQSIGEPGTQLTMRTFHTGGIFTNELVKQVVAPFSGILILPKSLKTAFYRTNHGVNVLKITQETKIILRNWYGKEESISLQIGSYLYPSQSVFLAKGELIAEFPTQKANFGNRKVKPLFSPISGEIKLENLSLRIQKQENIKRTLTEEEGTIWITAGKIISLPKYTELQLFDNENSSFSKKKTFAKLNIITPRLGIVSISENIFSIIDNKEKVIISLNSIEKKVKGFHISVLPLIRNFQYADSYTILGFFSFFPLLNDKIYQIRERFSSRRSRKSTGEYLEKLGLLYSPFSFITSQHVWQLSTEQGLNFANKKIDPYFFKQSFLRSGTNISKTITLTRSGFLLREEGSHILFQDALPIFVSEDTLLNYLPGEFLQEGDILALLVSYIQQTEDIVQGLPKIEELVEARKPNNCSILSIKPGVVLSSYETTEIEQQKNCIKVKLLTQSTSRFPREARGDEKDSVNEDIFLEKSGLHVFHSIGVKKLLFKTRKNFFEGFYLLPFFELKAGNRERSPNEISDFLPTIRQSLKRKQHSLIYYSYESKYPDATSKNLAGPCVLTTKTEDCLEIRKIYKWRFIQDYWDDLFFIPQYYSQLLDNSKFRYSQESFFSHNFSFLLKGNAIFESAKKKPKIIKPNSKTSYLLETYNLKYIYLEKVSPLIWYKNSLVFPFEVDLGDFIDLGQPLTKGKMDIHKLLDIFFQYHEILDGNYLGTIRSLTKFQLLLVNSIQAIYQSQGVSIASKHIDIIVKQMTAKVSITEIGDSPFLPGEFISLAIMNEIYNSFTICQKELGIYLKMPKYQPRLLSITNSALAKDSFLSASGFQETRKILSKAAIEGNSDWLRGLKESLISGRIIPAGTSFSNYKNALDNFYNLKKKKD